MDFMLIFMNPRGEKSDEGVYRDMGRFAGELAAQGKIKGGAPLHAEEEGARIRLRDKKPVVTDGPFTETKEVIAGFFLIEANDMKEAVEIAGRAPHLKNGFVEVRQILPRG